MSQEQPYLQTHAVTNHANVNGENNNNPSIVRPPENLTSVRSLVTSAATDKREYSNLSTLLRKARFFPGKNTFSSSSLPSSFRGADTAQHSHADPSQYSLDTDDKQNNVTRTEDESTEDDRGVLDSLRQFLAPPEPLPLRSLGKKTKEKKRSPRSIIKIGDETPDSLSTFFVQGDLPGGRRYWELKVDRACCIVTRGTGPTPTYTDKNGDSVADTEQMLSSPLTTQQTFVFSSYTNAHQYCRELMQEKQRQGFVLFPAVSTFTPNKFIGHMELDAHNATLLKQHRSGTLNVGIPSLSPSPSSSKFDGLFGDEENEANTLTGEAEWFRIECSHACLLRYGLIHPSLLPNQKIAEQEKEPITDPWHFFTSAPVQEESTDPSRLVPNSHLPNVLMFNDSYDAKQYAIQHFKEKRLYWINLPNFGAFHIHVPKEDEVDGWELKETESASSNPLFCSSPRAYLKTPPSDSAPNAGSSVVSQGARWSQTPRAPRRNPRSEKGVRASTPEAIIRRSKRKRIEASSLRSRTNFAMTTPQPNRRSSTPTPTSTLRSRERVRKLRSATPTSGRRLEGAPRTALSEFTPPIVSPGRIPAQINNDSQIEDSENHNPSQQQLSHDANDHDLDEDSQDAWEPAVISDLTSQLNNVSGEVQDLKMDKTENDYISLAGDQLEKCSWQVTIRQTIEIIVSPVDKRTKHTKGRKQTLVNNFSKYFSSNQSACQYAQIKSGSYREEGFSRAQNNKSRVSHNSSNASRNDQEWVGADRNTSNEQPNFNASSSDVDDLSNATTRALPTKSHRVPQHESQRQEQRRHRCQSQQGSSSISESNETEGHHHQQMGSSQTDKASWSGSQRNRGDKDAGNRKLGRKSNNSIPERRLSSQHRTQSSNGTSRSRSQSRSRFGEERRGRAQHKNELKRSKSAMRTRRKMSRKKSSTPIASSRRRSEKESSRKSSVRGRREASTRSPRSPRGQKQGNGSNYALERQRLIDERRARDMRRHKQSARRTGRRSPRGQSSAKRRQKSSKSQSRSRSNRRAQAMNSDNEEEEEAEKRSSDENDYARQIDYKQRDQRMRKIMNYCGLSIDADTMLVQKINAPQSLAAQAGLRQGDMILKIDDTDMNKNKRQAIAGRSNMDLMCSKLGYLLKAASDEQKDFEVIFVVSRTNPRSRRGGYQLVTVVFTSLLVIESRKTDRTQDSTNKSDDTDESGDDSTSSRENHRRKVAARAFPGRRVSFTRVTPKTTPAPY